MRKIGYKCAGILKIIKIAITLLITGKNRIILYNTPRHGNLGDQALLYAEEIFFKRYFPERTVICIPSTYVGKYSYLYANFIRKRDIVAIQAGGYLGTLWLSEEETVRRILLANKNRKIVILPQTCYYADSNEGRKALKKSREIYAQCRDLTIFTREVFSYRFVKEHFSFCDSYCVPDMALLLGPQKYYKKREGALLCLRSDLEKTLTDYSEIELLLQNRGIAFEYTDTVEKAYDTKERNKFLDAKWSQFAGAGLVITDRLHGMIFAILTETPCVVIGSRSHKIKGVYKWVKDLQYIKYIDGVEELKDAVSEVLSVEMPHYDEHNLDEAFMPLVNILRKCPKG